VDGRWLMASVRDSRGPSVSDSAASMLGDLNWLVGSWSAEENGGKMDVQVRWVAEKSFLERTYAVRRGEKLIASGVQMIGWNPQAGRIQSWTFTSGGGHATGYWMPRKNGWAVETTGISAEGMPTQAINLLTRLDNGAFSWQSIERSAGGTQLPDTEPVLLKRTESKK
jgi:hypothetical protein